ncbi:MAG: UDP binding domain-containing protein [Acidobacteriota bacterium]
MSEVDTPRISNYGDLLRTGRFRVAVWGVGYIGYSSLIHFAEEGVAGIAYDPDEARVAQVLGGEYPVPGLEDWLRIDPKPLVEKGLLSATSDPQAVLGEEQLVDLVCVPTEREGRPWSFPLSDVMTRLAKSIAQQQDRHVRPRLVIVESTLEPGTVDRQVLPILAEHGVEAGRDVLLGVAPRRDWFVDPSRTLRTLDRIYSGHGPGGAEAVESVLGILCDRLHRASSYRVAELVKCVENAYRHAAISLANQLTLGFPEVDMDEVLDLASTKWNMQRYSPSFGAGGYCIPLAGQYLLQGASRPDSLGILRAAFDGDLQIRQEVAESVIRRGRRSVGILGLAYRGDLKVSVMSPSLHIAEVLRTRGVPVKVSDPYYSAREVRDLTGLETFDPAATLDEFDTLIVNTDHRRYLERDVLETVQSISRDFLILDNYGIWKDLTWPSGTRYYRAGAPGWLASLDDRPEILAAVNAGSGRP